MFSSFVIGIERHQQHEDKSKQLDCTLRILKDRATGRGTGTTIACRYNQDTARLEETGIIGFTPHGDEDF
jgi:twinkle protein